jgi:hypothetical protein
MSWFRVRWSWLLRLPTMSRLGSSRSWSACDR